MRFRPIFLSFCIVAAVLLAGCTIPGTEGPSVPTDTPTFPGTPVTTPVPRQTVPVPRQTVPVTQTGPVIDPHDRSVVILTTPDRYIPLMSSTVGIRLDAEYNATVPVSYSWGTDYGHFVSWNATDGKVTTHDRYVETPDPSVYWTYPPEDMGKEKPPVTIILTVMEPTRYQGGGVDVAFGEVHLVWENNDTAVVKRP